MTRLNLHARIEIGLVTALLLGSCSSNDPFDYEFSDAKRDEIADLSADVAYDVVLEHEKVLELESRLSDVETRLGM